LANTATDANIAAAIKDVASYYHQLQKHEEPDKRFLYYQALSICRRQLDVVDQPGNEYAMWSQVRLAMSNVEIGDSAVQSAVDKLLAEFSDNAQIARGVHEVALKCRVLKKYEKAIELYQYVVDNRPDADYAAWSQMDLAKSYVALGDANAAEAAVNKLLSNFSNNPSIAQIVYDMANCYREAKKHPEAISLYKHIIDNWPQQKYAMWSLRDLAMSNFDLGDDPNAQAAVDKLIADYSDNGHIQWNVYEIAKYYRKHAKYKKAIELYQRIVDNWPGTDHALWSQLDLAMSYATIGEDPNAEAAIDKLVTGFSENQHIAGVVYEMAKSYRRSKKDENANHICNLIIGKWPKSEHAMWAQRDLARFNITFGDDLNAQAAVDKLLADFSKQGRIAQAVYDIAKQYHTLQKYEEAGMFYQYVIDNWPDDEYAMWAQSGLAKLHIDLGDDAAANVALDTLIADFNDNPALPEAVFVIGEQYYSEAFWCENDGLAAEARENFRKTIAVWERIIKELPVSAFTPQAYYLSAVCYRRLGENEVAIEYCRIIVDNWSGYRRSWHAQFMIGRCYEELERQGGITPSEAIPKIREAYGKLLESYPDCKVAAIAQNWLNRPNNN
jgi:tetratricopeptide (TPR) repeat protein